MKTTWIRNAISKTKLPLIFLVLMTFVIFIHLTLGFVPIYLFTTPDSAGTFGDAFGFINSLFSALGLGALLFTLIFQVIEFKHAETERNKALQLQVAVGNQQYFASTISAISTWVTLHSDVKLPGRFVDYRDSHLDYRAQKKVNAVILDVATEYLSTSAGDSNSSGSDSSIVARYLSDDRIMRVRTESLFVKQMCSIVIRDLGMALEQVYSLANNFNGTDDGKQRLKNATEQFGSDLEMVAKLTDLNNRNTAIPDIYSFLVVVLQKLNFENDRLQYLNTSIGSQTLSDVLRALDEAYGPSIEYLLDFFEHP